MNNKQLLKSKKSAIKTILDLKYAGYRYRIIPIKSKNKKIWKTFK